MISLSNDTIRSARFSAPLKWRRYEPRKIDPQKCVWLHILLDAAYVVGDVTQQMFLAVQISVSLTNVWQFLLTVASGMGANIVVAMYRAHDGVSGERKLNRIADVIEK